MDALQATYQRGQAEQAITRIQRLPVGPGEIPQGLRSDLKRLLDLDRKPRSKKLEANTEPNAFYDERKGPDKGNEVGYRAYHVFALLLAYRLVETGMTQSRAVAFLRDIRSVLEPTFNAMIQAGPASVRDGLGEAELAHVTRLGNLVERPERMTFLIARAGSKPATFMRMHPVYHDLVAGNVCSFAELPDHLMRFDRQREGVVIFGLTNAAYQVAALLPRIKPPRRGRPPSKAQERT